MEIDKLDKDFEEKLSKNKSVYEDKIAQMKAAVYKLF